VEAADEVGVAAEERAGLVRDVAAVNGLACAEAPEEAK
jgi:hypothetical protein